MQYPIRWLLLAILVGIAPLTYSATITVSDWTYNLPSNITNAGEYYPPILESELPTTAHINISDINTFPDNTWTLKASTTVTGLTIEVKRVTASGNSSDSGTLSGGENYITLTGAEKTIFTGTGNWEGIPLRFQISNLDVTDGYGDKNLPIQYSLTTP